MEKSSWNEATDAMKISKKKKMWLFILLIVLNLILRYSVTSHEIFNDSFEMHIMANSLSEFGEARWWVHPLSVIGMYHNSYASMISFFISGISQCTGLEIEFVTFVHGVIFGIFSIFFGYILAGIISDDDFFKFAVAFGYSLSPAVLAYSTWTAHARSPFILLLPLLIYTLLKSHDYVLRFGLITLVLSFLLLATHHLAFYLAPIFIGYFATVIIFRFKEQIKSLLTRAIVWFENLPLPPQINDYITSLKRSEELIPIFLIFGFVFMFLCSFLTHSFMSLGSRWLNLRLMINEYPRYTGILSFVAIGGFFYLLFKPHKRFGEWFLVFALLFITPFIQEVRYMKWFIVLFAILLAGIGLMNLEKFRKQQ